MKNILNKNLDLKGKKVLLRVDLNVPMKNGSITESSRIEKIIPTIKLLIEKEAKIKGYNTNIILVGLYLPKDKEYPADEELTLEEKYQVILKYVADDNKLTKYISNNKTF